MFGSPYILSIDTSLPEAYVCISRNGEMLFHAANNVQGEHAAFVHVAIAQGLKESNLKMNQLDAVAVNIGPGSYTGLRVGLATAKGICYAADKPIIGINGLKLIAASVVVREDLHADKSTQVVAMIDARRMEVFMAVYDDKLNESVAPRAMIITAESLDEMVTANNIILTGNGAHKTMELFSGRPYRFVNNPPVHNVMNMLSLRYFKAGHFENLNSLEPCYIKPFHDTNNR